MSNSGVVNEQSRSFSLKSLGLGFFGLSIIQLFSTLSYSVLYSTLVLYITGKLGLSPAIAMSITGVFVAFNYALHLFGGILGGRFLSYRLLFLYGMMSQVVGCLLLSLADPVYLFYGLGAFLTGSGLNVTCINCLLTQQFKPEDTRRETAFLWNYAAMNVGFFIGFTVSGYLQLSENYETLFVLASVGNLTAILLCALFWRHLADQDTVLTHLSASKKRRALVIGAMILVALPFVLAKLLHFSELSNQLVLVTGCVMMMVLASLIWRQPSAIARDKMKAFFVLMMVGTVFWTLFQMGPMGLTHFINHNVDRVFMGYVIPPQWFQNINTISIVFGGPLMGVVLMRARAKGYHVNIPTQFALALLSIGLAFIILPIGIYQSDSLGKVSMGWIVGSFFLQSLGELLISPIGYAMIGALAPTHLQGTLMGIWMLSSGVASTLASYSSTSMLGDGTSTLPLLTNGGYSHGFLYLGLFAMASSAALFLLIPPLKRWIYPEQQEEALALAITG
jgi:POT family proton-dependent oligopeptide transporter